MTGSAIPQIGEQTTIHGIDYKITRRVRHATMGYILTLAQVSPANTEAATGIPTHIQED